MRLFFPPWARTFCFDGGKVATNSQTGGRTGAFSRWGNRLKDHCVSGMISRRSWGDCTASSTSASLFITWWLLFSAALTPKQRHYCRCVFEHAPSPVWRPWPPAAEGLAAFAAQSCFLIARLLSESILSENRGLTRQDALLAELGGRGRRSTSMNGTCQLKLFSHFILLASYLFSCLCASLLGYVQTPGMSLCACLCARSAKVLRQRQLGVLKAAGGTLKPQSEGDCANGPRQKWKLGMAALPSPSSQGLKQPKFWLWKGKTVW